MAARRRPRLWPTKKALFALHGWLGMNFGLLLAWICLSGAIASLTHEIEWLTQPALRIEAEGPVRWQETLNALREAYPNHRVKGFGRDEAAVLEGMAWSGSLAAADGSWSWVRVDPHEARVVAGPTRVTLTDFVRQTHYQFFDHHSPWGLGFWVVTLISFPLLLSIVTALLFFKGWWKHLFTLRVGKGPRAFAASLHRLTGGWTLVFGALIGLTGAWYLVEAHLPYETAYPSAPDVSPERLAAHGARPERLPLDRYIDAAREAFPELEPTGISLPAEPDGTVAVEGRAGSLFLCDRANAVFMDPYDASVIEVRDASRGGALNWWVNAADSLHFGYWGGLATKILWAVLGLCLPTLVLSGAYLSWRRAGVIGAGNPFRGRPSLARTPWWRRRPPRTWILLPLAGVIVFWVVRGYDKRAEAPAPFVEVGRVEIGPWAATILREPGAEDGEPLRYAAAFDAGPGKAVNLRAATLSVESDDGERAAEKELRGAPRMMRAALPARAEARDDAVLELEAETWNGKAFEATLRDTAAVEARGGGRRYEPAAPAVFFTVVFAYAVLSLAIAGAWFVLDVRRAAKN